MNSLRNTALGALVTISLVGCSQQDQPQGMRGEFVLKGSTFDTLPILLQRDHMCEHTLLNGGMVFHDDTTYSSTMNAMHRCKDREPLPDDLGVKRGKYRVVGDTVMFYDARQRLTAATAATKSDTLLIQGQFYALIFVRR